MENQNQNWKTMTSAFLWYVLALLVILVSCVIIYDTECLPVITSFVKTPPCPSVFLLNLISLGEILSYLANVFYKIVDFKGLKKLFFIQLFENSLRLFALRKTVISLTVLAQAILDWFNKTLVILVETLHSMIKL